MSVMDTLLEIKQQASEALGALDSTAALEALRVKVLGKKGDLTALLKGLGQLVSEERFSVGA